MKEAVDISVSMMLCGGMTFQMMIFYAVNHHDVEMRLYSWEVLSNTISIFTSVLVFTAFNHTVEKLFLAEQTKVVEAIVAYLILFFWLTVLNFTTMHIARNVEYEKRVTLAAWNTLFAHTGGFASIAAGGCVQHFAVIKQSKILFLLVALVHCGFVFLVFWLLAHTRAYFWNISTTSMAMVPTSSMRKNDSKGQLQLLSGEKAAVNGDEVVPLNSAKVHDQEEAMELWTESIEDAENDVASISLSFLCTQGFRYIVSGRVPNKEGLEEGLKASDMTLMASVLLGVLGLMCAGGVVAATFARQGLDKSPHRDRAWLIRLLTVVKGSCAMCLAWCVFYTSKWEMRRTFLMDADIVHWQVLLALFVSGLSFAFIWFLDKLADSEATSNEMDRALESLISGLSVLVGFAWEQSFEGAVEHITEHMSKYMKSASVFAELLMSLLIALIVIPAWRSYILTNMWKVDLFVNSEKRDPHLMNDLHITDDYLKGMESIWGVPGHNTPIGEETKPQNGGDAEAASVSQRGLQSQGVPAAAPGRKGSKERPGYEKRHSLRVDTY